MKHIGLVLISTLSISLPVFAQHRGSSAGASGGLLLGVVAVVLLALVLSAVQRSFRNFFSTLGGLALMFILSVGGGSVAQSLGLVQHGSALYLVGALFCAMLLGPAIFQAWRHRRRSGA
jgi:thiamine transporter ThiT